MPRISPARQVVIDALAGQARRFPDMPPATLDTQRLGPLDARLAVAIHRGVLRRWLTLRHLLETRMNRRLTHVEPPLQAILLSGAAQLLLMERVPAHAAVDESVELAKRRLRRGAARMTNAVLRRVAAMTAAREPDRPWRPAPDRLPWGDGSLRLAEPLLPPVEPLDRHLSIATSHPVELVRAWLQRYGAERAAELLLHSLRNAPTIVHAPSGPAESNPHAERPVDSHARRADAPYEPHAAPGFFVWRGDHAALVDFLEGAPDRWVQDPASAAPVAATADLRPGVIIDYCAGRGTKTRQLAALHPHAEVLAGDPDADRFAELQGAFADHPRVHVLPREELHRHTGRADLLVLDVPCSNTGVLARRLEARYRYRQQTVGSVAGLQREILAAASPLLRPGGRLLYSTCSIEPAENEKQADRAAKRMGMTIRRSERTRPGGEGSTYHDGGYYALLERVRDF